MAAEANFSLFTFHFIFVPLHPDKSIKLGESYD